MKLLKAKIFFGDQQLYFKSCEYSPNYHYFNLAIQKKFFNEVLLMKLDSILGLMVAFGGLPGSKCVKVF
jgi:hypothetical protein